VNTPTDPPITQRPSFLAKEAKQLGKRHGFKVEVFDRKQIEKIGMGSFLAVAHGLDEPPRFIVMHYPRRRQRRGTIVLIGKGITFDTGGISLKPGAEMDEMEVRHGRRSQRAGHDARDRRIAAQGQRRRADPDLREHAQRAMRSSRATWSRASGQTIEFLNTDAEGRLILCDALTYAERFKPAAVIDIATLTGAIVIALGHHNTGLFASDDWLAAELLAASRSALDPAWRMPLDDEYARG